MVKVAQKTASNKSDLPWIFGQLALLLAVIFMPNEADFTLPYFLRICLTIVFCYGLFMLFSGVFRLGKSLTAFPKPVDNGQLLSKGIYHAVRHPMYGGIILAHLAYALIMGSMLQLFLNPLILLFFFKKSLKEESYLLDTYPEYAEYMRRTRRFIPFIV